MKNENFQVSVIVPAFNSVYFRILKGLTFPSKIVQPVSQEVCGEAK